MSRFAACPSAAGSVHTFVPLGTDHSLLSQQQRLQDLPAVVPSAPPVAAASPGRAEDAAGAFPGAAAAVGLSGRLVLMASVAAGGTGEQKQLE